MSTPVRALVVQLPAVVAPDGPKSLSDVDPVAGPVEGLHEDFRARWERQRICEPAAVWRDARHGYLVGALHERALFVAADRLNPD
jgi:hypothetical protein